MAWCLSVKCFWCSAGTMWCMKLSTTLWQIKIKLQLKYTVPKAFLKWSKVVLDLKHIVFVLLPSHSLLPTELCSFVLLLNHILKHQPVSVHRDTQRQSPQESCSIAALCIVSWYECGSLCAAAHRLWQEPCRSGMQPGQKSYRNRWNCKKRELTTAAPLCSWKP